MKLGLISLVFLALFFGGLWGYMNWLGSTGSSEIVLPQIFTSLVRLGPNAVQLAEVQTGPVVVVEIVNLEQAGYLAIHETSSTNLGRLVGESALLPPGEHKDIRIAIEQTYSQGGRFEVRLYHDDSDSVFDEMKDFLVRDEAGVIIREKFVKTR